MRRFLMVFLLSVLLALHGGGRVFALAREHIVLIDDPEFVRLVAFANPDHRLFWATDYVLEVEARNPAQPVEVSYLILAGSATPERPSQGVEVRGNTFIAGWKEEKQLYFHTEVGGWARPEFRANPQYFPLPHYRTCVLLLARYEKVYLVFLRENDGYLTYQVFRGGPFTGLEVDGLARVTRVGRSLRFVPWVDRWRWASGRKESTSTMRLPAMPVLSSRRIPNGTASPTTGCSSSL